MDRKRKMTKVKTQVFDPSEYIETPDDVVEYLAVALEEGDPKLIQMALRDIAKSKGMTQLAAETGLNRESLYKSLSSKGNPSFATILKVTRALGVKLTLAAA